MMKPRILVASASGKTGFATAMQLLEKKYPVCAFVQGQNQRAKILREDGGDIYREHIGYQGCSQSPGVCTESLLLSALCTQSSAHE